MPPPDRHRHGRITDICESEDVVWEPRWRYVRYGWKAEPPEEPMRESKDAAIAVDFELTAGRENYEITTTQRIFPMNDLTKENPA